METKEQLLSELESLKKRIESLDNKRISGWKVDKRCQLWLMYYDYENDKRYGFDDGGRWHEDNGANKYHGSINTPATPQEVEAALIKEAEKRGFKEGVRINNLNIKPEHKTTQPWTCNGFYRFNYIKETNELDFGGATIFSNGKWATIIKDETIKIGSYEVKTYKGDGISNGYTLIDGNKFTGYFWLAAKTISEHSKAKIMVGCSKQFDVSLETINAILNKL